MTCFKKRIGAAVAGLMLLGILTGCGNDHEKTDAGMQLLQELNYEEALLQFEEAVKVGEDTRLIARGQGIAYMGLTEYEQAVACFQSVLAESNGWVQDIDFDVNYYLASAYVKNGQYAEAKEIYDAILSLRPKEVDAYLLRGSVLLALTDFEHGKADLDKVIAMEPENYSRLIDIYEVLEYYGYREAGLELLQNALNTKESEMAAYDKGRIYYYMGEYQKAYIELEAAKEKGGAESYLYLGRAYEATGDYNYASSVYNSYLAKDTSNAQVYNQLGMCEMAKGDYKKALDAFQAGIKIENNDIMQTLSFNEIVAYEHLGEYQKASVLLDSYLKSYPDDEKAKREQIFLSTR